MEMMEATIQVVNRSNAGTDSVMKVGPVSHLPQLSLSIYRWMGFRDILIGLILETGICIN